MTEVNNKDNQNPKELNFHQLSEELFKLHNELRKNPQSPKIILIFFIFILLNL